nr:serine hydrolase domain-containing protein [Roseateles oligotrophus]
MYAWLAEQLPALCQQFAVPGAQLCLLQDGRSAWSFLYGTKLAAHPELAIQADTVFEAASMSKPVFAWLALRACERGRLALDRPLARQMPAAALQAFFGDARPASAQQQAWRAQITPRQLLSHRSGLPNWRDEGPQAEGPALPLAFEPGSDFRYSGEGYALLQAGLEHIEGLPLQDIAQRQLFEPQAMPHSGFVLTPSLDGLRARGHAEDGRPLPAGRYTRANAGYTLYTTAQDYARFLALMMADPPAQMLAPQVEVKSRPPIRRPRGAHSEAVQWSLGFALNPTAQGLIAYHSGANSTGFRAYSQFSATRKSGLVLLSNSLAGHEVWQRLVAEIGDL